MLYDEEEIKEQQNKKVFIATILTIIIITSILTYTIYELIKPLPQNKECKAQGYDAGTKDSDGNIICYDECAGRTINTCIVRNKL